MFRINLIRGKVSGSEKTRLQVLCKVFAFTKVNPSKVNLSHPCGIEHSFPPASPAVSPALLERLLGKSPLRLVASRTCVSKGVWRETLECGHEVTTYQKFLWDDKTNLVLIEPTAKRRRCQKCKPAVAPVLKTTKEITADQARAALVHAQKLKFGTLFDKLCFANGELRPGPTEAELLAQISKEAASERKHRKDDALSNNRTRPEVSAEPNDARLRDLPRGSVPVPLRAAFSNGEIVQPQLSAESRSGQPSDEAVTLPSPKPVQSETRARRKNVA